MTQTPRSHRTRGWLSRLLTAGLTALIAGVVAPSIIGAATASAATTNSYWLSACDGTGADNILAINTINGVTGSTNCGSLGVSLSSPYAGVPYSTPMIGSIYMKPLPTGLSLLGTEPLGVSLSNGGGMTSPSYIAASAQLNSATGGATAEGVNSTANPGNVYTAGTGSWTSGSYTDTLFASQGTTFANNFGGGILEADCSFSCGGADSVQTASASMSGYDAQVLDPDASPAISSSYSGTLTSDWGQWVSTNDGNDPTLSYQATDPGGVCYLAGQLISASGDTTPSAAVNDSPTTVNSANGTAFTSELPCSSSNNVTGSFSLPTSLPNSASSGTYSVQLLATDPGDVVNGGETTQTVTDSSANVESVRIDDQQPTVSVTAGSSGSSWTSNNVATVTATAGPSGLPSGVVCTNTEGVTVTPLTVTQASGNADGSGTTTWSVQLPNGIDNLSCVAQNGDVNQPLVSTPGTGTLTADVDASAPSVAYTGAANAGWITATGPQTVTVTPSAGPSGVSAVSCQIDGGTFDNQSFSNPVANPSQGAPIQLSVSGNGSHSVRCVVTNGAGQQASYTATVDLDSVIPSVVLSGVPTGWASSNTTITATANVGPSGVNTSGGINGGRGLDCQVDGGAAHNVGTTSESFTVSGNGPHSVSCTVTSGASITSAAVNAAVDIDGQLPSIQLSGATFDKEVNTNQTVTVTTTAGLSGLQAPACYIGGQAATLTTVQAPTSGSTSTAVYSFPVSGTGVHVVDCAETAGNGQTVTATDNVEITDVTPPTDVTQYGSSTAIDNGADPISTKSDPHTWYTTPQVATIVANPAAGAAPIVEIDCSGAALAGGGSFPADSQNETSQNGEQIQVTINPPGGNLQCTATDSAGNVYPLGSQQFDITDTAPTGSFVAQSQWSQPDAVTVAVNDPAGAAAVEIYAQTQGVTIAEPASQVPGTDDWQAIFDDSTITPGSYTFHATVVSIDTLQGSITAPAVGETGVSGGVSMTLPLRDMTNESETVTSGSSSASGTQDTTMPSAIAGTSTTASSSSTVSSSLRGHVLGHSAAVASVARATKACKPAKDTKKAKKAASRKSCGSTTTKSSKPLSSKKAIRLAFGAKSTVSGVLRDAKDGNRPVADAPLLIEAQATTGGTIRTIGHTHTDSKGKYTFPLPAGESRTVFVVYKGSKTRRGVVAQVAVKVGGHVSLEVSNGLVSGGHVTFTGHVVGGYVPAGGVLVTLEDELKGYTHAFSAFAKPIPTNSKGVFHITLNMPKRSKGIKFLFEALVPSQTGWAYQTATSGIATRLVG